MARARACCGSRPASPGERVDRRNRLTDGRLAVARMIGDGSDAPPGPLGLIELAASLCRPAEPACANCPLSRLCASSRAADAQRDRSCSDPVGARPAARSPASARRPGACSSRVATMRWNAWYSPACIAAARSASPRRHRAPRSELPGRRVLRPPLPTPARTWPSLSRDVFR